MKWIKELIPYVIIVIVVFLIRTYIITPVKVQGTSMNPTLKNGEVMILNKWDNNYKRFSIVVLTYENKKLIKRVIGVAGDNVKYKNNKLYINGKYVKENFKHKKTDNFSLEELGYDKIPEGYYLVLGDNRTNSMDSRLIGLINEKDIQGTTNFSLFPFSTFGLVK